MKQTLLVIGLMTVTFASGWIVGRQFLESDYLEMTVSAERLSRQKEQLMQKKYDELLETSIKEKQIAENENDSLRQRIRSNALRLSVPVACNATADTGNASEGTRAELDAKTADDLVAIANDGDDAIRDLNLCIRQYNAVRATLNE